MNFKLVDVIIDKDKSIKFKEIIESAIDDI